LLQERGIEVNADFAVFVDGKQFREAFSVWEIKQKREIMEQISVASEIRHLPTGKVLWKIEGVKGELE